MNLRLDPKPELPDITMYCDGSCLNNQNSGTGGWAAILDYNDNQKIVKGCCEQTTNNRMEIQAVIGGMSALKKRCKVKVLSDSQYVVMTMTQNWKRKTNNDLWTKLDELVAKHKVTFEWVKGHDENEKNEMANKIAQAEAKKLKESL